MEVEGGQAEEDVRGDEGGGEVEQGGRDGGGGEGDRGGQGSLDFSGLLQVVNYHGVGCAIDNDATLEYQMVLGGVQRRIRLCEHLETPLCRRATGHHIEPSQKWHHNHIIGQRGDSPSGIALKVLLCGIRRALIQNGNYHSVILLHILVAATKVTPNAFAPTVYADILSLFSGELELTTQFMSVAVDASF